ncbi:M14 family metallopeptidase [Eubacteriales bacterium OttesenSCG-928-K08]|nr:M14 family metallopeptidase [Eubacteriales bacterium OttesenSCG-928-K08]
MLKCTHTYDHYYLHEEITAIFQEYVEKYPRYVQLVSLAKTAEGRDIWLLELTDTQTGQFSQKPAYCACGPVHAQEVMGTMNIMLFVDYLLTNRDEPEVAKILADYTVYALPNPTPDGTECYLTTPEILRSVTRMYPFDELQPGLQMQDMDGDGVIRQMRFRDPLGPWKISKEDPRMMQVRDPDETEGEFYQVFREGMFLDGIDWREQAHNAPEKWGFDLNRSWPIGWRPEALQKGAGHYPLENIENRTIADFLVNHKNICTFMIYHCSAGVFFYPPSYKHPKEAPRDDIQRYKEVLRMGTEETGYPAQNVHETFCVRQGMFAAGSLDDFLHFGMGLFSFACECWDLETQAGIPGKWDRLPAKETAQDKYNYEYKTLRWVDEHIGKDVFKPWTKLQHPQLGEVEIGGFDYKFVIVNAPNSMLREELEKTVRFMRRQIKILPRIELSDVRATRIEDGVYRVEATVVNKKYLPTNVTTEAINMKMVQPDTVSLQGEDIEFLTGKSRQKIGFLPGISGIRVEHHFTNYVVIPGAPIQKQATWVIRAKPGTVLNIHADSDRAGHATAQLVLPAKA